MENKDPDLIAKNACVEALFSSVTGSDPYLSDSLRAGIDSALSGEGGDPAPFDAFVREALELSRRRGAGEGAAVFRVNLRLRPYEPLWTRSELVEALKPMVGCRCAVLVVSGLQEAVLRSLPARRRRGLDGDAVAEARHYIDALAARFSASGCRMTILYTD